MSEKAPLPVDQSGYKDIHNLFDGHIDPLDIGFRFDHELDKHDDTITNTGFLGSPQVIERTQGHDSGLERSLIAIKGPAVHGVQNVTYNTLPNGREFLVMGTVSGMNQSVKNEDDSITNNLLNKDGDLNKDMEVGIAHITPGGDHESPESTVNYLTGWRAKRAAEIIAGRAARHIEEGIKERRIQLDAKK